MSDSGHAGTTRRIDDEREDERSETHAVKLAEAREDPPKKALASPKQALGLVSPPAAARFGERRPESEHSAPRLIRGIIDREVAPFGIALIWKHRFQLRRGPCGRTAVRAGLESGVIAVHVGIHEPGIREAAFQRLATAGVGIAHLAPEPHGEPAATDRLQFAPFIKGAGAGDLIPLGIFVIRDVVADYRVLAFPLIGCPVEGAAVTALVIGAAGIDAHADGRGPVEGLKVQACSQLVHSLGGEQVGLQAPDLSGRVVRDIGHGLRHCRHCRQSRHQRGGERCQAFKLVERGGGGSYFA